MKQGPMNQLINKPSNRPTVKPYTFRHCSTTVESPLQIHLFLCKTKPIYWFPKMNVNNVLTRDYENKWLYRRRQNKPKTNQIKPNTKPIKPNTKPIKANSKPIQTQFKPRKGKRKFDTADVLAGGNSIFSGCVLQGFVHFCR